MRNLDPHRAKWIRFRMSLLCGLMMLGLGVVISTAYRVQVEDSAGWKQTAENQRQRRLHVDPKRGAIYDRNGQALAASVEVPSVTVDVIEMLRGIEGPATQAAVLRDAATRLGAALALDPKDLEAKLAARRRFLWVKRRVTADEAQAVRDLSDPKTQRTPLRGLAIEGEGRRYYPGRDLAGPLLGFVAPDGLGKDGLEYSLDEELRGHANDLKALSDRAGRSVAADRDLDAQSLAGHDVVLTIDQGIQHVAEHELEAAQRTYETKGASLVVLDPNTGEILALVSVPRYNPNDYGDSDVEARRSRVITDRFEPGSVMKVFTVAAALAGGTLKPTEPVFCEHGSYRIDNVTVHDTHDNAWLSPTQVLARSSNIGASKIALNLGEPALYSTLRRFGFGEPTGLPLAGEASGVLRPKGRPWFDVETANASFGQGVSVTTLQLALALGAIANGGRLLDPILVRRIVDARGAIVREWPTHVRREVVSESVAKTVAEMLTAVVEEGGTGVEAALEGFRVAGKTATAQKVDPATGQYSEQKYTASFMGFVPAERPRLVIVVTLDEPMIGHYGGDLAGPVFRRVAESSLRYLGVSPAHTQTRISTVTASDDPVDRKTPPSTEVAALPNPAPREVGPPLPSTVRVPDAMGMGARDALRALGAAGLVPVVEGTGRLVKQIPPPGAGVPRGSSVRIVLEPAS